VKQPVVVGNHMQSNKFATGVKSKAPCTVESKVYDSPDSVDFLFILQEDNFSGFCHELLQNPNEGSVRRFSDYMTEVRFLTQIVHFVKCRVSYNHLIS